MDTSLKDVRVPNLDFDDFDRTGWACTELQPSEPLPLLMCLQYNRFTQVQALMFVTPHLQGLR